MAEINVDISTHFDRLAISAVLPGLRNLRDDIKHDMVDRVPVESGHLRDTIFCDLDEETGTIEGGATASYAEYVEFGHHEHGSEQYVAPEPFVRPAFLAKRGDY